MPKINILHLNDSSGQGGAETIILNIVNGLQDDIFFHYVFLPNEGWLSDKLFGKKNVKVVIVDGKGRFNFGFIRKIFFFIKKNRISIIHAHLLGVALYGSVAGFLCRVPVVTTFHGYVDYTHGGLFRKSKLIIVCLLSKKVIAVSRGLRNYLASKSIFFNKKIDSIYNGVDLNQYCKFNEMNVNNINVKNYNDNILIGSIGNVKDAKGYDILIDVACSFLRKYINAKFLIAGNTDHSIYKSLLEKVSKNGLEDKIIFLGYIENKIDFLDSIDIFILTSVTEGFSLSTVEAMLSLKPVVATKCGGPEEIIIHNKSGYLAEVGDINGLTEGLFKYLSNPEFTKDVIVNASRNVRLNFNLIDMINKYKDIYMQ